MDQYTEKAKEALALAMETAESMGVRMIGTEHILVGLIQEGSGTAARVLEANDVKLEKLLALEQQLVASYQNTKVRDRDGYTPSARHVLENSYREAVRFRAPLIRNRAYSDGTFKGVRLCGGQTLKYHECQYPEDLH